VTGAGVDRPGCPRHFGPGGSTGGGRSRQESRPILTHESTLRVPDAATTDWARPVNGPPSHPASVCDRCVTAIGPVAGLIEARALGVRRGLIGSPAEPTSSGDYDASLCPLSRPSPGNTCREKARCGRSATGPDSFVRRPGPDRGVSRPSTRRADRQNVPRRRVSRGTRCGAAALPRRAGAIGGDVRWLRRLHLRWREPP
jgi:hypothetical protein